MAKRKTIGKKSRGISVKVVLEKAAAKERAAQHLYTGLAKEIEDASARGLLVDLAAEEKRHARMLTDVARSKNLAGQRLTGAVVDLHIAEFLKPVKLSALASFQEVLIYALKREVQSQAAYEAMAKAVSGARVKKLCRFLAGQERAHKTRLEHFYDDVIYREN